jgi:hypothetical protein
MNAAQYARHRGISKVQVGKYIAEGKITARRVGRSWDIDADVADRELEASRSPDRGGRNGGPDGLGGGVPNAGVSFAHARAVREQYAARILRLEFEQRSGRLVEKNELKLRLAKLHLAARDNLRSIPDRVAPVVAAETDPAKIHALLLKEIGQALEGLQGFDWR